jgi:hypothetical protein
MLLAWVPGLRRARVVTRTPEGLPEEIQFEFSTSLMYSLVYTYDLTSHEVTWEPRANSRDGVSGFVRFAEFDDGTRMIYGLKPAAGRSSADLVLGDLDALVDAFVVWMRDQRAR